MTGRQNGFVGREGRLADLVGDLARARAGSPRAVLVVEELVLSVRTVEFHVGSVYRKLSVSSRSQLTRFILQAPAANA